jgi:hypothetical protein
MATPVFLLGAGFNADVSIEISSIEEHRYPLTADLAKKCFGICSLPENKSIEDLFYEAVLQNNFTPIKTLCELLMEADYYLTPLLKYGGVKENNVYLTFLRDFKSASFLTFNYDSLVEILLLSLNCWLPNDGYGIPVHAELRFLKDVPKLPEKSISTVSHLHGSLCIYPSEYYIRQNRDSDTNLIELRDKPIFIFDPDSITDCYFPFARVPRTTGFRFIRERVIAPIPDKAEGLNDVFIHHVYDQAIKILAGAEAVVIIGYSFNLYDRDSYHRLLDTTRDLRIVLVIPEADILQERLRKEYPNLNWYSVPLTFREWVRKGYPGI